ncbi:hypothetical protein X777_12326, partial [Ooceraea biroi]
IEIKTIDVTLLTRRPLAVTVIKVNSPSLIWVHIKNSQIDYQEMREDLQVAMSGNWSFETRQMAKAIAEHQNGKIKIRKGDENGAFVDLTIDNHPDEGYYVKEI